MNRNKLFLPINLFLGLLILVMINLISTNGYVRLDLTHNNAYSLSAVSKETLALTEDPLRVKVFYNAELPAPYNGVRQYLLDLLREYSGTGGRNFSYEVIDPTSPQGKNEARKYGLQQVTIQEVRSDEFQSKAVYMGAVVLYGNVVERIDRLTSTNSMEYRLTTAMRSAITQADALSGTSAPVTMRVIASPSLQQLNIRGFDKLQETMRDIHRKINADNYDRIEFEYLRPENDAAIDSLSRKFGIEPVSWKSAGGQRQEGLLDIVLSYQDKLQRIPLRIYSGLLGAYSLEDPQNIEESVRKALQALVAASPRIAYATGNGEKSLQDSRQGAAPLATLAEKRFKLVPINPAEEPIPSDIDTLIINGPTGEYSEAALYRIDQFVMNGGSLFVLMDRNLQSQPSRQAMLAGKRPQWNKSDTGLEPFLKHWGAELTAKIVLDEQSYVARQSDGPQKLFQAPVISGEGLNRKSVITAGLQDVILFNATQIKPVDKAEAHYIPLLQSSSDSWTVDNPAAISPYIQGAPPSADTQPRDMAVLLQGSFTSNYDAPPNIRLPSKEASKNGTSPTSTAQQTGPADSTADLSIRRFRNSSATESRIIVLSTSAVTTAQLLNPQQRTPNSTFLMNSIDYLNGSPGFAELRSKGLGVPRIDLPSPFFRLFVRWGNVILVPLLVLLIGGAVWLRRRAHARRILATFTHNREVQ